ncbi:MAG: hypothetical protein H6737_15980 [Alphaproteobacteria bacterium]|nr:hypothetical protein [Alphaproteobacteria bacterium]
MLWLTLAFAADPQPLICCDQPVITEQLKLYLKFEETLIAEGPNKASAVLYRWAPVADKAAGSVKGRDRVAMQRIATLTEALKNKGANTLRTGLVELSQLLTFLVVRHPGGSLEVFEARCQDDPWLQRDGTKLVSPYGDCGEWRVPAK